jgi:hypothetical protein
MVKTKGQSEAVIEEGQTAQWSKQSGNALSALLLLRLLIAPLF